MTATKAATPTIGTPEPCTALFRIRFYAAIFSKVFFRDYLVHCDGSHDMLTEIGESQVAKEFPGAAFHGYMYLPQ